MNPYTDQLAKKIANTTSPLADSDHSLVIAHEIIAKVRINGFTLCEPTVSEKEFDEADVTALREALISYAQNHADHKSRATAYWGLAVLHNPDERDFLRSLLRSESKKELVDENALRQIMIALDNIGEDIFVQINQREQESGDLLAASQIYLSRS